MKIGCGTVAFRELPLEEATRRIAEAGSDTAPATALHSLSTAT